MKPVHEKASLAALGSTSPIPVRDTDPAMILLSLATRFDCARDIPPVLRLPLAAWTESSRLATVSVSINVRTHGSLD